MKNSISYIHYPFEKLQLNLLKKYLRQTNPYKYFAVTYVKLIGWIFLWNM